MICPSCESDNTSVYDSRLRQSSIRRRRVCYECHTRFTTYEIVANQHSHETLSKLLATRKKFLEPEDLPETGYVPRWLRRQQRRAQ